MRWQYPWSANAPLVQIEVICVPSQRNQSFLWLWEETKHEHTSPRGLKEGPGEAVQRQSQHQIRPTSAAILSLHIKPHPLSLSSTLSISLSEGIIRALKRGWLETLQINLWKIESVSIHLEIFVGRYAVIAGLTIKHFRPCSRVKG